MQQFPVDPSRIVQIGMMVPNGTPEPSEGRVQRVVGIYRSLNPTVANVWRDGNTDIAVSYEVCPPDKSFTEYLQADAVRALKDPDTRAAHAIIQFRSMLDPNDPDGAKRDIALVTLVEPCAAYKHDVLMLQSAELVAASDRKKTQWWKLWS